MPDLPSDDHDSRTASVAPRAQSKAGSRQASLDPNPNPRKRQRRNRSADARNVQDFVPQGATFSAAAPALEVDPDHTSSSGSDSDNDDGSSSSDDGEAPSGAQTSAPAAPVNWNKGNKSAIRTSLRGSRKAEETKPEETKPASQFDAVNDKFWRSRSESTSSVGDAAASKPDQDDATEEGEVDEESSDESSQMQLSGDSDDSDSLDSEADDSILLNIGSRAPGEDGNDDYNPEALSGQANGKIPNGQDKANGKSKEDALLRFAKKYPTAPSTLADLDRDDMDIQAKYRFYDRDINAIDLQLPIACTECLQEGHLGAVCPSKECVHCNAWNQHQSSFCPTWRRCQRCRERGHDEDKCPSVLKSSASETPCDLCGSSDHLELDCDQMWKFTQPEAPSDPILVSLSCAHCTSNRHLIGDCPSLPGGLRSSSWTLNGIDPNMITNINTVVTPRRGGGASGPGPRGGGMKIRGRADPRPSSSDSEDMMPGRRAPVNRGATRSHIRFGSGIGRGNKNLAPAGGYRDRNDYSSGQRSMSPNPRPSRGRGKDSWQPNGGGGRGKLPPRPPPRGGGNGGRGGGRGGKRGGGGGGGGGDTYRPMPSAGKKAWDKYRL
ncbi:hypothetical protein BO71DRAFT_489510 [Aspergillus ellipticus CBS 707.79]|uniref:CCHC-type domain-containing protein n=1 Tax=Aspergillus ellipticus CBS 707.79 TaxID=1448320 RepID=A0A319CT53_9EURO|nr:hypothetical protein BO71DRAFT_489510 [Aspergillus ellipticus CBS 707.79]